MFLVFSFPALAKLYNIVWRSQAHYGAWKRVNSRSHCPQAPSICLFSVHFFLSHTFWINANADKFVVRIETKDRHCLPRYTTIKLSISPRNTDALSGHIFAAAAYPSIVHHSNVWMTRTTDAHLRARCVRTIPPWEMSTSFPEEYTPAQPPL